MGILMMSDQVPQETIDVIAQHINSRNNKNYNISVVGVEGNPETPQYFEIIPFDEIDETDIGFYAVDGSMNSQPFFNGLAIGVYRAGYICYRHGKQVRMNNSDDPVILGQAYTPQNILLTQDDHKHAIYEELLRLPPVERFLEFLNDCTAPLKLDTKSALLN
jgi:hypothetical protein